MERVNIFLPTGLKDHLKDEARARGMYLHSYIASLLESRKAVVPTAAKALVTQDKRDPEVQGVIEKWTEVIGNMPRQQYQRRAAKTLLQRHGIERVLGAIKAVEASKGERYAPVIPTLEALRDRWTELEIFYQRKSKDQLKNRVLAA